MGWRRRRAGRRFPGTHKSNYRKKLNLLDERDSGIWESCSCLPGSLLIFPEGVRHTSCPWEQDDPRMALFFCYNYINVRHHKPDLPPEMLDALTPERRRFFNEVYHPQCDRW